MTNIQVDPPRKVFSDVVVGDNFWCAMEGIGYIKYEKLGHNVAKEVGTNAIVYFGCGGEDTPVII